MLGANKSSYQCYTTNNSEHQDLVKDLLALKKKLIILNKLHNIIIKRGLTLGRERIIMSMNCIYT
jgi:tRNA-(ms[2]io[6]A)-hydroxylase